MKVAFIYGGQGSQVEEMGKDLYEEYNFIKSFYDSIEPDFPLKDLSFRGDLETISKTRYTQPILLAFQMAVTKVLKHYGIKPDIAFGLSLGEYSALHAAGVLGEEDLFQIIQYRAKEMDRASKGLDSKMLAVFTDDIEGLEELCKKYSGEGISAQVSNINTKGQIVISGDSNIVTDISGELKKLGYRFIELNTSGPFHTSYMDGVSEKLEKYFSGIEFNEPKLPIIHNFYGGFKENVDIKEAMWKQVNHPVLFKSSIEELLEEDPDLIIEIGYGNVIKGLVRRVDRKVEVKPVNTVESIEKLVKEVLGDGR